MSTNACATSSLQNSSPCGAPRILSLHSINGAVYCVLSSETAHARKIGPRRAALPFISQNASPKRAFFNEILSLTYSAFHLKPCMPTPVITTLHAQRQCQPSPPPSLARAPRAPSQRRPPLKPPQTLVHQQTRLRKRYVFVSTFKSKTPPKTLKQNKHTEQNKHARVSSTNCGQCTLQPESHCSNAIPPSFQLLRSSFLDPTHRFDFYRKLTLLAHVEHTKSRHQFKRRSTKAAFLCLLASSRTPPPPVFFHLFEPPSREHTNKKRSVARSAPELTRQYTSFSLVLLCLLACTQVAAMIGEWAAGTLPQSYPKYWSPSVTIHAGPGKVSKILPTNGTI